MKTLVEVLVDHQRQNASSCLCGWAELGKSHPEHQAAALAAAGFGTMADARAEAVVEVAEDVLEGLKESVPKDILAIGFVGGYADAARDWAARREG